MRYALLTITFLSGLGLTVTGLSAQTQFPMSVSHVYLEPVGSRSARRRPQRRDAPLPV